MYDTYSYVHVWITLFGIMLNRLFSRLFLYSYMTRRRMHECQFKLCDAFDTYSTVNYNWAVENDATVEICPVFFSGKLPLTCFYFEKLTIKNFFSCFCLKNFSQRIFFFLFSPGNWSSKIFFSILFGKLSAKFFCFQKISQKNFSSHFLLKK